MVQWRGRRRSSNVEDRRGQRSARRVSPGRGGGKLKGGIGTLVLIAVVYFMGGDVSQILGLLLGDPGNSRPDISQPTPRSADTQAPADDAGAQFVSVILADTEDTWDEIFKASDSTYPRPRLRLFTDGVNSACGFNSSAVGPFYCPGDQRVYLDLGFFAQLEQLGAPGDFAQAYVIGHEIGHHVQNVTGVLRAVSQQNYSGAELSRNQIQVLVELQADCYAGAWAYHAETQRNLLEPGDLEEGLQAAASIGDDHLQQRAGQQVRPESFTHGSSAQRVEWFRRGFNSGRVEDCDTFAKAGVNLPQQRLQSAAAGAHANAFNNAQTGTRTSSRAAPRTRDNAAAIQTAFARQQSDVQVSGSGTVIKVLSDDTKGSAHQRFIMDVGDRHTVLVAHNIDLAPRVAGLRAGDVIEFTGEYEWNDRGGVLHWTHHDPAGRHPGGYLRHRGRTYQ